MQCDCQVCLIMNPNFEGQETRFYCSTEHAEKFKRFGEKIFKCAKCSKDVSRVVKDVRETLSGKNYCSKSCSNADRERTSWRAINPPCTECGKELSRKVIPGGICAKCLNEARSINLITKGEFFAKSKNWQSARSMIQRGARDAFTAKTSNAKCGALTLSGVCGYKKHIQVCHIKAVSDFSDETLIGEINNLKNLVGLCPNHHWEFDHNCLDFPLKTE